MPHGKFAAPRHFLSSIMVSISDYLSVAEKHGTVAAPTRAAPISLRMMGWSPWNSASRRSWTAYYQYGGARAVDVVD
ncbi:hypothetical protein [Roseovarius tolerans]|nr:hypothetical protein [Roseovarius tolerans]